ncbi:IS5 family transposase [Dactylosporangium sp. AC04546]|uniref:IS5 family transposase n=1 Tax=Dactylosporangium sp. AC04546 TaxID=2862460 RepID=UPI001EE0EA0C|nr:IS5 family transposase [Dactylosporangium sp. AC04546]WVK80082.1 IS5 family transposase [Dactylosporangium sp. AC04546]
MTARFELTDAEWDLLRPLLPTDPPRGGRWQDHRTVISGILFRERTGIPWRDLPARFGNWKTVYQRKRRWALDGTWQRIAERLRLDADLDDGDDWTLGIDSSVVRAHQHAAGARHQPPAGPVKTVTATIPEQAAEPEALGRSRGGFSTKLHLAADRRSRPVSRTITAGQRHDRIGYPAVMASIRIPRRRGRPRTRPARILGDKAYSIRAIRADLRRRGIAATIPERADQQANRRKRGAVGGRPPAFDAERYRQRNTVERAVSKLKQFRAVATRYDKRAFMYLAAIDIAIIKIWLRDLATDPRDTA